MNTQPIFTFVLPSRLKNNTYIELFISSLKKQGIEVPLLAKDSPAEILKEVKKLPKDSKKVIHVHWPTVLYGSKFILKSLGLMVVNFSLLYILKRKYDCHVVWTMHNTFAHDYPHPWIDCLGMRFVRTFTDVILVQQKQTLALYRTKYPSKRVEYVPHGNYIGVYGDASKDYSTAAADLRREYGFAEDDIVLLSLGAIAPYKRNEKIIDAVKAAQKILPKLKLLIVGKEKGGYADKLIAYAKNDPAIVIRNQFVPDSEIPAYLALADRSVFYYDESEMTSGGLILSFSYGVPVVTRNIPGAEIVNEQNGVVFQNDEEFVQILQALSSQGAVYDRRAIIENIKNQSWDASAQTLVKIYGELS